MAYKSDINIKLSQIPELGPDDVQLLPVLQPVYNAIHTLTSLSDSFLALITPPEETDAPEDTFVPYIPSFWAKCQDDVTVGKIVTPITGGWRLGPSGRTYITAGENTKETWVFGFVLDGPVNGRFLIGWPPFLIKIEGVGVSKIGKRVYTDGHGELFIPEEVKNEDWAVGIIVAHEAVIIEHRLRA